MIDNPKKLLFYSKISNRGIGLIGMICFLFLAGIIASGFYYYLEKQIPEISENINQPPVKEVIKPTPEQKEELLPEVSLSNNILEQGDTLLVKVKSQSLPPVKGIFNSKEIDFLSPEDPAEWIAILGISTKAEPGKYDFSVYFSDGSKIQKEITVQKRDFPVTRLLVTKELEEKGYTPSKIAENITTKENIALREILGIYVPEAYFKKYFIYPLEKIIDVGAFGDIRKSGEIELQHLGVDLDAEMNTPVYAVNDGIIRFTENLTNYGKTLIIDHGLGIFSLYLHLNEFKVSKGDFVKRGEAIGLSGNTGYSIAPHLHFSVKVNEVSVDPLRFIETLSTIDK